jgi:4-hydroxy-tetrahydrodipicolinate reductase
LESIRVVSYGIGVIGQRLARHILKREGVEIVGAVDINPDILGKDLGRIIGAEELGVSISKDADMILEETEPDIVCHTTLSYLRQTFEQFRQIINHGVDVISTCEELSYPYATVEGTRYAEKLDRLAKDKGATLLGTGINPGFLMDTLPTFLTGVCEEVEEIIITRQMDAATRRIPFQKKIGAGMTVAEFKRSIEENKITGHVGLEQSIQMIADALGWALSGIRVSPVEPVVLGHDVASEAVTVPTGHNAGSKQKAFGILNGNPVITMDFRAFIGAPEEYDGIEIKGIPPINQKISPCVHGDHGTIAITTNMIPHVVNAKSGLLTMLDMPIPHYSIDLSRSIKIG